MEFSCVSVICPFLTPDAFLSSVPCEFVVRCPGIAWPLLGNQHTIVTATPQTRAIVYGLQNRAVQERGEHGFQGEEAEEIDRTRSKQLMRDSMRILFCI